ncbi:hypothetical protein F5Y11DRAFT_317062, partial [Daldinia sp. FL1419]
MVSSSKCEIKETASQEAIPPPSPALSSLGEDAETMTASHREVDDDALSVLSKESRPDQY